MQQLKCQVYYCILGQTLVFVKNMSVLNLWHKKVDKKCSNCKNKVTFTHQTYLGSDLIFAIRSNFDAENGV